MNISYVTTFPSIDIKYWSGTMFYMAQELEKHSARLNYITGLEEPNPLSLRIKRRLFGRKKKYISDRSPQSSKAYAKQILDRLDKNTDIIFSPGSIPLAYLETDIPKVFYTDCTFSSMLDYYEEFSNLSKAYIKEGMEIEQRALKNCQLAIYSSDWAAQSAINDYGADPSKVKVVPLGANISKYKSEEEISNIIKEKDFDVCKILLLGVDWYRKGGPLVLDTVNLLNERAIKTELHVVGISQLPISNPNNNIINHGFLNKNDEKDMKQLESLLTSCHFLFVPSKAEAYGVVFCEAMAYGLPPISCATGGIPTIIKNDLNGIILATEAQAEAYANKIEKYFSHRDEYNLLAHAGYHDFRNRLNWDTAMSTVVGYMQELIK